MNPLKLTLRKNLLTAKHDLAVLELMLEQALDDYKEVSSEHAEIKMVFIIQQYQLDIKRKKYDIEYLEKQLV